MKNICESSGYRIARRYEESKEEWEIRLIKKEKMRKISQT